MFGAPLLEHDSRYEFAAEWFQIVKALWTSEDLVNFEGKYFRIVDASIAPHPIQKPHPVVMNAGGSGAGRRFGAKYCDVVFISPKYSMEEMAEEVAAFKRLAREDTTARLWCGRVPMWSKAKPKRLLTLSMTTTSTRRAIGKP